MEAIREILVKDKEDEYYCQHKGKFYRFGDIDPATWEPKPGAEGTIRAINNREVFRVGNIKVYF